jgi:hypothetical protein
MEQLEQQLHQLQEQIGQLLQRKAREAALSEEKQLAKEEGSAGTLKKEKGGGKDGKLGFRNPFYHRKEGK